MAKREEMAGFVYWGGKFLLQEFEIPCVSITLTTKKVSKKRKKEKCAPFLKSKD